MDTILPGLPSTTTPRSCGRCGSNLGDDDRYCPKCGVRWTSGPPWYYHPVWILVLSLVAIGPLALFLVWRAPVMSSTTRWSLAVFIIVYTIVNAYLCWVIFVFMYDQTIELQRTLDMFN